MTLYELFQSGVKEHCFRPAICFYDGIASTCYSYNELAIESQKVVSALDERYVKNHVIAVTMPTGIHIIATLLGVLGSKNCFYYLNPLDLKSSKRFDMLKNKIKFTYCLTDSQEAINELELLSNGVTNVYKIDGTQLFIIQLEGESKKLNHDIVYVVTTSGSTGQPKIVYVPNKSIVPNILNIVKSFQQSADDVIFMSSPLTFDPSYVQMFTTFYTGSCLLVVDDNTKSDVKKLLACITILHQVTILQTTPSLLLLFGDDVKNVLLSTTTTLKVLAFGGEKCPNIRTLQRWKSKDNKTRIFNIYGITEVSCWASIHEISSLELENLNSEVCLGEPLDKTILEIRNFDKETSEGELWIGGDERICIIDEEEDPTVNSVVMRPSGDIVKKNELGTLHYVGRSDGMIKRMGKRMHLEELNEVMMKLEDVLYSTSLWHKELLLLFVVLKSTASSKNIYEDEMFSNYAKQHIKSWLPLHYLPSKVLLVNKMPINSHGKVNKNKLLQLYSETRILDDFKRGGIVQDFLKLASDFLNISTFQESHLLKSWTQLGGNSIMAVSIHSELQDKYPNIDNLFLHRILSDASLKHIVDYLIQERTMDAENLERKRKHKEDFTHRYLKQSKSENRNNFSSNISIISRSGVHLLEVHNECFEYVKIKNVRMLNSQIPPGLKFEECWKFDTGKCVDASPLIIFDKESDVFIGSHSFSFASLNLHSGACNWKVKLEDRIESSACLSKCSKYVVTACYSGNIYVLERSTGNIHWIFIAKNSVKSSPVTHPHTGIVYVGSHDGSLYALDIQDKACKWHKSLDSGALFSSPCVSSDDKSIFIGSLGGVLFCIEADDGLILWHYSLGKPIFSSPATTAIHCLIGCVDGCIYAINTLTKQNDWKFVTDGPIFSSPKVFSTHDKNSSKEVVLIGSHDKHLYSIDATSGSLVWKSRLDSEIYGIPCLLPKKEDNSLTSFDRLQEVYGVVVCSTKGVIYMLHIDDGSKEAVLKIGSEIFSSPCAIDNKILVGCRDNYLYCIEIK